MAVEGIAPHFTVGNHFHAGTHLQGDAFVNGAIFRLLEGRIRKFAGGKAFPRFLQVFRPQKTANHIAAIHTGLLHLRVCNLLVCLFIELFLGIVKRRIRRRNSSIDCGLQHNFLHIKYFQPSVKASC